MLIDKAATQVLIIDMQERLLPAMADAAGAVAGCVKLMRGADALGVPVVMSEQYPRGLGPTVPELAALAPEGAILDKVHFSCAADPAIMSRLQEAGRKQVVIGGVEAHVCVLQTAISLKAAGFEPFVVVDAVSSRLPSSIDLAQNRLSAEDVTLVNAEMVLFEWMQQAGTPEFKALSPLVR